MRASVTSGRGVYWSRSRGGLWRKGDTSGAWQVREGFFLGAGRLFLLGGGGRVRLG